MNKRSGGSTVILRHSAAAASCCAIAAGAAAQQYDVVDIGVAPLNSETIPVARKAINNAGQVAAVSSSGFSFTSAVRYTPGVGLENLDVGAEDTVAHCINEAGQICGVRRGLGRFDPLADFWRYTDGIGHVSITTDPYLLEKLARSTGIMNDSGTVVAGFNDFDAAAPPFFMVARTNAGGMLEIMTPAIDPGFGLGLGTAAAAMNSAGVFVGQIPGSGGVNSAYRYGDALGFHQFTGLGGTTIVPVDINDLNQTVGIARTSTGSDHAFFHSDATGFLDIHSHPTALGSAAFFINDSGMVAGTLSLPAPGFPGFADLGVFRYTQATGMQDLGSLAALVPAGFEAGNVRVEGISSSGHLVGTLRTEDPTDPNIQGPSICWYWSPGTGFVDLEASVDASISSDYDFDECRGINDSHQILVVAADLSGFRRTLILTPPASACACERDGAPAVDVFDLLAYLDLWFAGDAGAEMTGDSPASVDVFDLLAFLDCWFPASSGQPCP